MSASPGRKAPEERLDAAAVVRLRRRLASAATRPWLHDEVSRRMAERLSVILAVPRLVLDWSADAATASEVLRTAYPRARIERIGPGMPPTPTPKPWWRPWASADTAIHRPETQTAGCDASLVWSNMRLQIEADPMRLMRAWRAALAADGFVMFSTLGPGSLDLLRDIYAEQGWGVAHAPFVDMHDLGDMMVECGMADPVMDQETLTLTYASPERLLDELRELGLNADPGRFPGLRTPAWRARLLAALAARAGADGRIPVRWELVYGHAFRAPDRGPAVAENTTIALNDMKLMLRKQSSR